MRKMLTVVLAAIMCFAVFAFAGCGVNAPTEDENGGTLEIGRAHV